MPYTYRLPPVLAVLAVLFSITLTLASTTPPSLTPNSLAWRQPRRHEEKIPSSSCSYIRYANAGPGEFVEVVIRLETADGWDCKRFFAGLGALCTGLRHSVSQFGDDGCSLLFALRGIGKDGVRRGKELFECVETTMRCAGGMRKGGREEKGVFRDGGCVS